MNCSKCGAVLVPGAMFCQNCGLKFATPVPGWQQPLQASPPPTKIPITQQTWFVVASFLFCNIFGFIFLWINPRWSARTKQIVTACILVPGVLMVIYAQTPAGKRAAAQQAAQDAADAKREAQQERDDAIQKAAQDQANAKKAAAEEANAKQASLNQRKAEIASEPHVSPDEIASAYNENEVAANKQYDGKKVILKGSVGEVKTAIGGLYVDVEGSNGGEVTCYFDDDASDQLANLHKGDSIAIEGTGGGEPVGFPVMNDCDIVR